MVMKIQELICLEWASRKSEWENLAILRTAAATASAANLAAKDYYRISFGHSDEEGDSSCNKGLKDHLPEAFEIATTEDLMNNNLLDGAKTICFSHAKDLIVL